MIESNSNKNPQKVGNTASTNQLHFWTGQVQSIVKLKNKP